MHKLSGEDRNVLATARPATLAQAQRLPGLTPAGILSLLSHLKRSRYRRIDLDASKLPPFPISNQADA